MFDIDEEEEEREEYMREPLQCAICGKEATDTYGWQLGRSTVKGIALCVCPDHLKQEDTYAADSSNTPTSSAS